MKRAKTAKPKRQTSDQANNTGGGEQRLAAEHRALLAARALIDRMRKLYQELEQLTDAPIGLHRALNCIGAEPGIHASDLALALGIQRPAASQALKAMSERGWISRLRSDVDQRAVKVYLTVAGERMLDATAGRAVGKLQQAMSELSDADIERLDRSLPLLVARLPRPSIPDIDSLRRGALPKATATRRKSALRARRGRSATARM